MAFEKPFHFKRSTRSWVMWLFFCIGIISLLFAFLSIWFRWFGKPHTELPFLFAAGLIYTLGGAIGLIFKREWELEVDQCRLAWRAGKRSGQIPIDQIREVRVEEGNARYLVVIQQDSAHQKIPGDCYGNASELANWFNKNHGSKIKASVIP